MTFGLWSASQSLVEERPGNQNLNQVKVPPASVTTVDQMRYASDGEAKVRAEVLTDLESLPDCCSCLWLVLALYDRTDILHSRRWSDRLEFRKLKDIVIALLDGTLASGWYWQPLETEQQTVCQREPADWAR